MKRLAVLTSGGDAPGMNAAVRATVRYGIHEDLEMFAVRQGFSGLLGGRIDPISARDVGNIIERAGSVIGCSRDEEFNSEDGVNKAVRELEEQNIHGLVVIGGDGSMNGAYELAEKGIKMAGVPATIDNDVPESEMAIGVDTALNVALNAIDQLRVTASALHRGSIVEVMGRNHGYIALRTGLAGGAEAIVIPELETDPDHLADTIRDASNRGKTHALIVVSEGAQYDANELVEYFQNLDQDIGFQLRKTILGHVQRGGDPTAFDRNLGSRLGGEAVRALCSGEASCMIGWNRGKPERIPLKGIAFQDKELDTELMELARVLAR